VLETFEFDVPKVTEEYINLPSSLFIPQNTACFVFPELVSIS